MSYRFRYCNLLIDVDESLHHYEKHKKEGEGEGEEGGLSV